MTSSILAAVDRLISHFKLVDSLTTRVLMRLVPRYEVAASYGCGPFCLPTSDFYYSFWDYHGSTAILICCNCCS